MVARLPPILMRALRLPGPRWRLLFESGWALARAAWRVRRWPFARLAATLGSPVPVDATQAFLPDPDLRHAQEVRWAMACWARRWHPTPTCLMQAAAAQQLLARRGEESILLFGVQSLASTAAMPQSTQALGAHAWLCCKGVVVTGASEAARFRPIAAYRLTPPAQP